MGLTLYKKDTSPPSRSVFMTIHALNIPDVKFIDVYLPAGEHLTEEYIKMNPQHTVPLLIDDDFLIWDSKSNLHLLFQMPLLYQGANGFKEEHLGMIDAAYDFMEKFLTAPWLAGDDVTLADICCVSTISSMNEIRPIDKET
ncbi:glutathione S-transferase 1-like [Ostrinia furnacalis]|uniref:glutathione S-transferase 1-like n=1 Tax=Ostrinia furnacalis TaxID=93504 RepID=UPI00103C2748|nr:glutathione S-transferase 1-like [Ostrinia furnacalis]